MRKKHIVEVKLSGKPKEDILLQETDVMCHVT